MDTTIPRLLTPRDVAQVLHMPSARVTRLARTGLIPCVQLPDGELVFREDDLARWIKSLKHTRPGGCSDDNRA
jgi:hypothetical protein